jgi:hypothetical protein
MNPDLIFGQDSFVGDTDMLETLTKTLTAGYGYEGAPGALAGGGSLQVESLDNTLRSVTWDYRHLRIWPIIPKDKAFNTVEQYNRQISYGSQQNGGFFDADLGVAPQDQDANFHREYQKVRYIGTTRQVSHPMTVVRTAHGPAIALQIQAGTMWILEQMERQLWESNGYFQNTANGYFTGDPAFLPAGTLKYNGLDQQIRYGDTDTSAKYTGVDGYNPTVTVVKNMSNTVPDEDDLTDWGYMQSINFGVPTHAFLPLKAVADISRTMLPKERVVPPGQEGRGGFVMTEFICATGVYKMVGSRFLEPKRAPVVAAQTGAPATPVIGAVAAEAPGAGETSELPAGNHYVRVSAFNHFGESLACAQNGPTAIVAGQRLRVTIAAGTVGALYYAVFRSQTNGSGWEFVGYVTDTLAAGGGGAIFRDAGKMMPGLGHGYLTQLDSTNVVWRQLAPLMKMDLAITGPAFRWMQLLYGTPIVFAPLHNCIMDNIGRA